MSGSTRKKAIHAGSASASCRAFAAQVRAARQLAGKTQQDLAKESGVGLTTIEALEAERSEPYPSTRKKIAIALQRWGVTLKDNGEVGAVIARSRFESPEPSS